MNWQTRPKPKRHPGPGPQRQITCPLRKICVICETSFGRKVSGQGYFESKARFDNTECCSPECFELFGKYKRDKKIEDARKATAALAKFNLGSRA